MSRWRCLSCEGEYDDIFPDGLRYFHACPPLEDPITLERRERDDRRDENIDRITGDIKLRGKGREKVKEG